MTIRELRILPPLAIGRLGSAKAPADNFTIDLDVDPASDKPLGFRPIKPAPTLIVDEDSGAIRRRVTPHKIEFKHDQKIRPVAPFLEVFAIIEDGTADGALAPLTLKLLKDENLSTRDIGWRAIVSNRKVERRTGDPGDKVVAMLPEPAPGTGGVDAARDRFRSAPKWIGDHDAHTLRGRCDHFCRSDQYIDFGHVRFIKPTPEFPEIRLRFTPAAGMIYGPEPIDDDPGPIEFDPHAPEPYHVSSERAIYDRTKGRWVGFGPHMKDEQKKSSPPTEAFFNETVPPSLFAIDEPAPPWLYDNVAFSRGYLDDACDGFIEVRLKRGGGDLVATARICAAPPALAPDSLFVRNLADDLEQVVRGPKVEGEKSEETLARAQDIVRRAYETARFMNVAVMNGNDVNSRPALALDSMPEEEAAGTQRAIRPVMPAATVDTLAIMALHQQAYAALQTGAAPWFARLLRKPDEAGDYSDRGRRKMPALMCGADNNYLALTWRQIDTIEKAARAAAQVDLTPKPAPRPRNMSALKSDLVNQINYEAAGNPISSRPVTSVANCCPGLEMDFRAVWRRMFKGLVLREHDNLVITTDADIATVKPIGDHGVAAEELVGHRLLRIFFDAKELDLLPAADAGMSVIGEMRGPSSSDAEGTILITSDDNPDGVAPLEWSNALAKIVAARQGGKVICAFSKQASQDKRVGWDPENYIAFEFEVRNFFDKDTAVISQALADAGELTQGLCSPWQNDYRECSCYYWASARPDFVNVEPGPNGLSIGDNWMQRARTKSYVADDYADRRLIMYDELFRDWEKLLKFQIGGHDVADDPAESMSLAEARRCMAASAPRAPQAHVLEVDGSSHILLTQGSRLYDIDGDLAQACSAATPGEMDEVLARAGLAGEYIDDAPLTAPPLRALSLAIAQKCNLGCAYCYAEQGDFGGRPKNMTLEDARRAIDLLAESAEPDARFNIAFLGGEPLVNRDVLRQATLYAQERLRPLAAHVGFSITTNGTLLREDDADFFEAHGFAVTVSIDGLRDAHDALRPFKGGRGSFDDLMVRVAPLLGAQRNMQVSARVTVTPRNLELRASLDEFVARGFHSVGFSPMLAAPNGAGEMQAQDLEAMLAQMIDCGLEYERRTKAGRRYPFANMTNALREIHRGTHRPYPCGAGAGYLGVSADGGLAACHRFVGDEEGAMGTLAGGIDRSRQNDWLAARHVHRQEPCNACWARYLCGGGCHHETIRRGRPACDYIRGWLHFCFETYLRLSDSAAAPAFAAPAEIHV